MTIPAILTSWMEKWISNQRLSTPFQIFSLLGDGSTRSFYRVKTNQKNFILLYDKEWTLSQDYPAHQIFLMKNGLPVPEFFASDPAAGCLLMEDLGDELLQARILAEPALKMSWLKKATVLLAHLHGKTYPVPKDLPVASRSFDKEKYFQEFSYTLTHLSVGLFKDPAIPKNQLAALSGFCGELEKVRPLVFSHRDYHTRNLLPKNEGLVMIDFQDARMGPPHYDLASLLYDPYVPVTDSDQKELLDLYQKELSSFPLYKDVDWKSFVESLKLVAFQRMVKAAGSFASFYTRNGKTTHLPYLVPALNSALLLKNSSRLIPRDLDNPSH